MSKASQRSKMKRSIKYLQLISSSCISSQETASCCYRCIGGDKDKEGEHTSKEEEMQSRGRKKETRTRTTTSKNNRTQISHRIIPAYYPNSSMATT
jgi:hypothetical protein